jgi:hypothetical protein
MIEIHGLTKKQSAMLDIMWSMDSFDEVVSWQSSLPLEDQYVVETLMELVALAYIDEAVNSDLDMSESREIMRKFHC